MQNNSRFPTVLPEYLPLPNNAVLSPSIGEDACPWLEEYIDFSRLWSPRSYDGYHVGCGLFVLSTIAARRIVCHFGKPRFPNLFIALTGRTSINAKSSAASIAKETLSEVGLGHLLLPDSCTPQSMIALMSSIPADFNELTVAEKQEWYAKIPFLGQKGWFHEEFGGLLSAMMRRDGIMADFKSILRRLDDGDEKIDYSTIARGYQRIANPYLSLLGLLPPSELQPYARRGASIWNDGFLARIMFFVAPTDYLRNGRFPREKRVMPSSLLDPLKEWHARLGTPKWAITQTGLSHEPFEPKEIRMSEEVFCALYEYDDAIREIMAKSSYLDLDGNYSRFAEKALRISMLFASLDNSGEVAMRHWGRAQQIVEELRKDTHVLYSQVSEFNPSDNMRAPKKTNEEKVLNVIDRHFRPTKREIEQYSDLRSVEATAALESLINSGLVVEQPDGKTSRFVRAEEEAPDMQEGPAV